MTQNIFICLLIFSKKSAVLPFNDKYVKLYKTDLYKKRKRKKKKNKKE